MFKVLSISGVPELCSGLRCILKTLLFRAATIQREPKAVHQLWSWC